MSINVHHLHQITPTFGHYVRLGHTGHRILEELHASSNLPLQRAIVMKEEFNSNHWKRASAGQSGGAKKRVYFRDLDCYFEFAQAKELFSVKGSKSQLACTDPSCCP